jgi:hypothetical protein
MLLANRLYWVDAGTHHIEYVNVDGTGRTLVESNANAHYFGVDACDGNLYYTDWNQPYVS